MFSLIIGGGGFIFFLIGTTVKEFQNVCIFIGSALMFVFSLMVVKNNTVIYLFASIFVIYVVRLGKYFWKRRSSNDLELNSIRD